MTAPSSPEDGRQQILRALRVLARRDTRDALDQGQPAILSAFVTRHRENIGELVLPEAGLVIVIDGCKEVLAGAERRLYRAGDAFILPAKARVDVVNEPDPQSGVYRALFIRFPRELVIEGARLWPQYAGRPSTRREPTLTAVLCSAILHCAEALSHPAPMSRKVRDHRILEILLVLAEQGAFQFHPKYMADSVAEAVRLLLRHRLHLPWTAAKAAAALSLSEATLRRRLRAEGTRFQDLLRAERMQAAFIVLHERDADVAEALAATGYRSRSHFGRHFQRRFGETPAAIRLQKRHPSSSRSDRAQD
ncbi:helix-turn-helix domain-containing protein [Acidisoma sp. 7E03]